MEMKSYMYIKVAATSLKLEKRLHAQQVGTTARQTRDLVHIGSCVRK